MQSSKNVRKLPVTKVSILNHAEGVHIINSAGIVYHQHEVLYIINPQVIHADA